MAGAIPEVVLLAVVASAEAEDCALPVVAWARAMLAPVTRARTVSRVAVFHLRHLKSTGMLGLRSVVG
jgi:hypothetical protein